MKPIHIQIYEIGSAKNCRLAPKHNATEREI
jgi:hypothetical protein